MNEINSGGSNKFFIILLLILFISTDFGKLMLLSFVQFLKEHLGILCTSGSIFLIFAIVYKLV